MTPLTDSLYAQAALLSEQVAAVTDPRIRRHGLTSAQFQLLSVVRAAGGRATQVELAERLGITPPSLSELARMAVKKGLIVQLANDQDGRTKRLALTDAGRKALRAVLAEVNQAEREMVIDIDADEVSRAIDVLRRANLNLARARRTGAPPNA